MSYLRQASGTRQTPQSEPIPGAGQVPNSAGGYAWEVGSLGRLRRFCVLGSEGGTYYISERKLTRENVDSIRAALAEHGPKAVEEIVAISVEGRAPKTDPALFALAVASGHEREDVRKAALAAIPDVCRTGTHLLHFVDFAEKFRGHGPAFNRALRCWYTRDDVDGLAYQMVKYRERDGWRQSDLLRLARPKPPTPAHAALFRWAISQRHEISGDRSARYEVEPGQLAGVLSGFLEAQESDRPQTTAGLIRAYNLPREAVKPEHLNSIEVWDALLEKMPIGALIRNLATMTRIGLLKQMSAGTAEVVRRLSDAEGLKRGRVHPIAVLSALTTYEQGHGFRGSAAWDPVREIVDALDGAFYLAFGAVEPSGKRTVLALDVSGSMVGNPVAGVPGLDARTAGAAMALVTAAVEPHYAICAFASGGTFSRGSRYSGFRDGIIPLDISPKQRLDDVLRKTAHLPFGGTDAALPVLWAERENLSAEAFVTYTDSETWAGTPHPSQALVAYRQAMNLPDTCAVIVAMTSNGFSIADPRDPRQLDVVGFDTAAPQVISDFAVGRI